MMATEAVRASGPNDVSVLHRVSRIVSSELSLDEMLGEIVGLAARVTGCDACLVYLAETNELVLRASQVPHAADLGHLRMKIGEGVTGWVAEHQSPVALASSAALGLTPAAFSAATAAGTPLVASRARIAFSESPRRCSEATRAAA